MRRAIRWAMSSWSSATTVGIRSGPTNAAGGAGRAPADDVEAKQIGEESTQIERRMRAPALVEAPEVRLAVPVVDDRIPTERAVDGHLLPRRERRGAGREPLDACAEPRRPARRLEL